MLCVEAPPCWVVCDNCGYVQSPVAVLQCIAIDASAQSEAGRGYIKFSSPAFVVGLTLASSFSQNILVRHLLFFNIATLLSFASIAFPIHIQLH